MQNISVDTQEVSQSWSTTSPRAPPPPPPPTHTHTQKKKKKKKNNNKNNDKQTLHKTFSATLENSKSVLDIDVRSRPRR